MNEREFKKRKKKRSRLFDEMIDDGGFGSDFVELCCDKDDSVGVGDCGNNRRIGSDTTDAVGGGGDVTDATCDACRDRTDSVFDFCVDGKIDIDKDGPVC